MSAPALGPICPGDKSILDYACTHMTSGLEWPAFDTGWIAGRKVIAPERVKVYDATSSSQGGDAFYCEGDSKIKYWVAHIGKVPAQGSVFAKGAVLSTISPNHPRPHVHLALDARKLLGGKHLESGELYSFGAPTIGQQLNAASPSPEPPKEDSVYPWLDEWIEWDLQGKYWDPPQPRPAAVPKDVPDDAWPMRNTVAEMLKRQGAHKCWQEWMDWKDAGEPSGKRPGCAPQSIPEEWHEARKRATA